MIAVLAIASLFLISAAQANPESSAFVWTDKKEYDPSETAYIFGYGFKAYAQVTVTIQRPDLSQDTVLTSTDEFGYFTCQYVLDGIDGMYNVTATDGISTATTTFHNSLSLTVTWDSHDCTFIKVRASGLTTTKSYYVKYFDPARGERRTSPTYTGVREFRDDFTILPTLPNILGTWNVTLYENGSPEKTKTVYIDKMVWTTDSTYTTMVTSFAQGETVYFNATGLLTTKYYKFRLDRPDSTKIYVGVWTTGVTTLTGSYALPSDAQLGTWKLHVRQADDAAGGGEKHYVDCRFTVTTPPPVVQYYLTVQTDPANITTIPGEGWYPACTNVSLAAPEFVPGPAGVQYRFDYWDVDGAPRDVGVDEISIIMDANHTATAHYVTQYYLNLTTSPPGVTVPFGIGWYDAGTNASIFAPEFISITPEVSRYRFDGWTTADMAEIANASSPSTTVFMDKVKTVTANYVTQYLITFNQTVLDGTATGTVVTFNGVGKTYSQLPNSTWFDSGSLVTYFYSNVSSTVPGKRFNLTSVTGPTSPFIVTSNITITGNYKTQYQITVTASPGGAQGGTFKVTYTQCGTTYTSVQKTTPWTEWVDASTNVTVSEPQDIINVSAGTRYKFDRYDPSSSVHMDQTKTITLVYKTQYKVTVTATPSGAIGGTFNVTYTSCGIIYTNVSKTTEWSEWVDKESTVTVSGPQQFVPSEAGIGGVRYGFNSYSPSATVTMTEPKTIILVYKTQYYLTLATNPLGVTTPSGGGWCDNGTYASINTTQFVDIVPGASRYRFINWTTADMTEITNPASPSTTVRMDKAKTVIANYITQYYLTVISPYGTPGGTGWYDNSSTAYATLNTGIVDHGNGTRRVFTQWSGDASGTSLTSNPITMNASKTAVANWKTQHLLTVRTDPTGLIPQPTRSLAGEAGPPGGWWYDSTTSVQLTAQTVMNYDFLNWDVDTTSVPGNPITVPMDGPHVATAHYKPTVVIRPVGGYAAPIDIAIGKEASHLLASQIGLAFAVLAAMAVTILLTKRRSKTLKREY